MEHTDRQATVRKRPQVLQLHKCCLLLRLQNRPGCWYRLHLEGNSRLSGHCQDQHSIDSRRGLDHFPEWFSCRSVFTDKHSPDHLVPQILRELPADDVAHTAVAVSRSGRVVFSGTSSGAIRAIKYPLPSQKEWIMYQAHCGPVTKVQCRAFYFQFKF